MNTPELYLLEWKDPQPSAREVKDWLIEHGIVVEGTPVVYANGTLAVECYPSPITLWATYEPPTEASGTGLASYVRTVVEARAELLAIPEHERTATQQALLALIELVLFGFGVNGHG